MAQMPLRDPVQRLRRRQPAAPAQLARGLAAVQAQLGLLGRTLARRLGPGRRQRPVAGDALGHLRDGDHLVGGRPEVPVAGRQMRLAQQPLGQAEVAVQAVEHMLPGPHAGRVAQRHRLPGLRRGDDGRHQLVRRPVAAADHVARARRGHRDAVLGPPLRREEGGDEGLRHQLRAGLAVRVRIAPAQRLVLAVAPEPALVVIDLVGGDVDQRQRPRQAGAAHRLEQVRGAHHVGRVGAQRIGIRVQHHRLRGHVQQHLGREVAHRRRQRRGVAHVAGDGAQVGADAGQIEQAGRGRRRQREAQHLGAEPVQQQPQPGALEAGVAGQHHPAAAPEGGIDDGGVHGVITSSCGIGTMKRPPHSRM